MMEQILPDFVHSAECTNDVAEELHPIEQQHIRRAVDKRRAEFTTVRHCARVALASLGYERPAMVPGEAGAPTWPAGVVGSMTHCAGFRAATVARNKDVRSIGIDAEPHEPLPPGLDVMIASSIERDRIAELSSTLSLLGAERLLFSAKESVYKAWYPLECRWLGFEDADVTISADGSFYAEILPSAGPLRPSTPRIFKGRWLSINGFLMTSVVVEH